MVKHKDSTLSRMLSILLCVTESRNSLTSPELAEQLGLPKPTAYRLVNQLHKAGLLKHDPLGKGHVPGNNLKKLACNMMSHEVFYAPRKAILQQLSEEIGETCNITVLDGRHLVYYDRIETQWPIRIQLPLGSKVPLHCTASGKLFLAKMTKRTRNELIASLELERFTDKTITDRDVLESELQFIRETGIGTDNEEFITGMVAIAVPVIDRSDNMIFTIAVHAPTVRQTIDDLRQYIPALRRAAEVIGRLYSDSEA